MSRSAVHAIQRHFPQIYFACHVNHVRTKSNRHHLSAHDSGVLAHLDERIPTTPTALARHLGVGASTLSAGVKRLVALGHISRQPAPEDRRRWQLHLTAKGAAALAETSVLDSRRVTRLLAQLSAPQQRAAVEGLALLASAARAAQAHAPRRPRW